MITNIKILTSTGRQIDYSKAEDLSIKMNRVADDLQDIENRIGEYSYSFSLPMTRNNVEIFGYAGIDNVLNIFKINPIEVKVYNNDLLLFTGQLELQEIDDNKYKCVLYSKLTQLADALQDKNMQDIKTCPKIDWNYEDTIRAHINSGFTSCDETPYQFPLIFYNTFFCPTSVFTGLTDTIVDSNGTTAHYFQRERDRQNFAYLINRTSKGENEMYMHQIPLAFYLKSAVEYMLEDVGWSMGGSFWEDRSIKKIIVPYVGDTDVYDRAVFCSDGTPISAHTCIGGSMYLDTAKFMPDMDCLDFLENIIKLFNLYMTFDINQKTVTFESYDVMFGSRVAPYNIDNKIITKPVKSRVEDYNPSLKFNDVDNKRVLGDNRYIASSGTNAYNLFTQYRVCAGDTLTDSVFNHIGSTDGEISIKFNPPLVKTMRIRNDYNYVGWSMSAGDHIMFLPMISKQLPEDNGGKNFSKKDSDSTSYNTEETIQYNGKPCLYYYYGISTSDLVQKTGKGAQSDYFFVNFDNVNQKIPFCSPFANLRFRGLINAELEWAGQNPLSASTSVETVLASYVQSLYLMFASTSGITQTVDYHLILNSDNSFGDTIYTRFHETKYKRYRESEVLTAKMRMTDVDWSIMTINQPIQYNKQIYSIVEIKNFDVAKQVAEIKLIKMV